MTTAKKNVHSTAKATQTAAQAVHDKTAEAAATAHDNVAAFQTTSENIAQAGSEVVKDFLATSTQEIQRQQEKAFSLGREQFEKLTESADKVSRSFGEIYSLGKEQSDAVLESSRIATDLAKELHEQFVAEANELFNENVELSKELLGSRNLQEYAEVQNRALQANLSSLFNNGARLTEAWFRLVTEVSEPLSSQTSDAVKRFNKAFKA